MTDAEGKGEPMKTETPKRYGLVERINGFFVLIGLDGMYLVNPRSVEVNTLRALQFRKAARLEFHGETE